MDIKLNDVLQGALSFLIWGAVIYLSVTGEPVPDVLVAGGSAIIGFWFGTSGPNGIVQNARKKIGV